MHKNTLHIYRYQREDVGIWLHVLRLIANPIYNLPHFTISLLQNSFYFYNKLVTAQADQ